MGAKTQESNGTEAYRRGTNDGVPVLKDGEQTRLLCPLCGGDYLHPIRVRCRPPGRVLGDLVVDPSGLHLDATAEPIGRGVRIGLSFWCECCDGQFTYVFHFHKGWTLFETMIRTAMPPSTLWRD